MNICKFLCVRDFTYYFDFIHVAQDQVYKELQSYDKAEASPHADAFFGRPLWRPGSGTADDVFQVKYAMIYFILLVSHSLFDNQIKMANVFNRKLAW